MKSALETLRARGCKMTSQRRSMLALFFGADEHLTAPEVFSRLAGSDVELSRATVYNNLDLFAQEGLLSRVACERSGLTYYERAKAPHHHAVCGRCGAIFDVALPEPLVASMTDAASSSLAGAVDVSSARIWFDGCCRGCAG